MSNNASELKTTVINLCLLLTLLLFSQGCKPDEPDNVIYLSHSLQIKQLTENTFVHISFIDIPDYGKFACNGMIYKNGSEVVVFDTPSEVDVSRELLEWIEVELQSSVKAVIINHFHDDCVGGLEAFHHQGIPSYATNNTIELVKKEGNPVPNNGFDKLLNYPLGDETIINKYFGPAHSVDNIVSYIPTDEVLFGGCMIKSLGAGKGNLEDANVVEWPKTVATIKKNYPELQFIIPGHGDVGDTKLLDYTIELMTTDTVSTE